MAAAFLLVVIRCAGLFAVVPLFGPAGHSSPGAHGRGRGGVGSGVLGGRRAVLCPLGITPTVSSCRPGRGPAWPLRRSGRASGSRRRRRGRISHRHVDGNQCRRHLRSDPRFRVSGGVRKFSPSWRWPSPSAGGIHREAVRGCADPWSRCRPARPSRSSDLAARVVGQAAGSIALAIRLAFPRSHRGDHRTSVGSACSTARYRNSASPTSDSPWHCWRAPGRFYLAAPPAALMAAEAARSALAGQ